MKTATLVLALLVSLASVTSLTAQIGVGVRGGSTFSTLSADSDSPGFDYSYRTGYYVGIPVEIRFPGPVGLQIEANYTQFGAVEKMSLIDFEFETNYLNFPVLLKVGKVGEKFEVSALAGPSFGYALSTTFVNSIAETKLNYQDGDTRGNIGGVLGLQFGLPLNGGKLMLDARYNHGFNDTDIIEEVSIGGAGVDINTTNRQFSIGVAYLFTFGA